MKFESILKKKNIISKVLARENARLEMLRVAKKLKENGYIYLIFSDNVLHLARYEKNHQDVIDLEVFNNSLYISKYRYGKETKLRIIKIFSNHKHTTASRLVAYR